jgi:hypothetical protein
MNDFMNTYFGPLGQEYCIYFYALSIFFGIAFMLSVISVVTYMITHINKIDMKMLIHTFFLLINSFLAYLVNRLLHTMCVKSV